MIQIRPIDGKNMTEKRSFIGSCCFDSEYRYCIFCYEMKLLYTFNKLVGKPILLEIFLYENEFLVEIMKGLMKTIGSSRELIFLNFNFLLQ